MEADVSSERKKHRVCTQQEAVWVAQPVWTFGYQMKSLDSADN